MTPLIVDQLSSTGAGDAQWHGLEIPSLNPNVYRGRAEASISSYGRRSCGFDLRTLRRTRPAKKV